MKNKLFLYLLFSGMVVTFFGCNKDFLDRPSKDQVDANFFFNTPKQLEVATNDFYRFLSTKSVYTDDASSDNIVPLEMDDRIKGSRIVPTKRGSGGWSWSQLRSINYFLDNYHRCPDPEARAKYSGIARFFRAYFYFKKVKRFGDVPWYNTVLSPSDSSELYKARDSRELIIDSVMADLDYAIANMPSEKKLYLVTKYTALLLKARVALYEGTFRKYHQLSYPYKPLLETAAKTANELITNSPYQLYTAGGADKAYRNLFARNDQDATETILAAEYEEGIKTNNLGYLMTAPTMGAWGISKDLINSYLMDDGSRFTDQANYKTEGFYDEMQDRDPRLTQTTAGPDFVVNGESSREPVDLSVATTGYRVIKALPNKRQWSSSHFDIILFRYAEALLIYAEAKAELGTITQADLDKSVNKLRDRVDMPHMSLSAANANPDPYLEKEYVNVDKGANEGVILEIRRERRIELFNEGHRWADLMRWKEGQKIEQPMVGIYFSGLGGFDFNNDGDDDVFLYRGSASGVPSSVTSQVDINQRKLRDPISGNVGGDEGNIDPHPQGGTFDEDRDYFYPIPIEDLKLNKNLEQNPGWGT